VQLRDVRWLRLSGNGLNVESVLRCWRGVSLGRAEAAACEERERERERGCGCGCGRVCVYLPYAPPLPRENCITSPTSGLAVMDGLPTISVSDPFTPLALLASSLVPNWLLKAVVDADDVNSVLGMGLGLPIRLQYYANKALKPILLLWYSLFLVISSSH